jgi:acyl-CoA reductase-like NAD-dependent aldehyde dehydrogenase
MTILQVDSKAQGLFIDGVWREGTRTKQIVDRWSGEPIAKVALGSAADAREAVDVAERVMRSGGLTKAVRARILLDTASIVRERADSFADAITVETGKPITASRAEVARAVETLTWAGEEAKRIAGEGVPLDGIASGEGTLAFTLPQPRGIVAAITPFNFPLNLLLHKVAPAIAAGCAVVLKPSEKSMLVAGLIVSAFHEAGLPAGWLNLLTGTPADVVEPWLEDPRVAVVTFTGSTGVGWGLKARSPRKLHILELGSNTAMVVTRSADLERAASDALVASLSNSGQACVSLQRLYVDRSVAEDLLAALAERFEAAAVGDPHDEATLVGPMITDHAAAALAESIRSAVNGGARLVVGGSVDKGMLQPTLLADVDPNAPIVCEEAFGPVLSVIAVDGLDEAIERVNASDYALNTAIYTGDLSEALEFSRRAEAGSVLVNMPPSYRADHMPYGGVKDSGQGTEGVRYAIEELLHDKLVVLKA